MVKLILQILLFKHNLLVNCTFWRFLTHFVTQACPGGPAKIAPLANHFFFDTMNEKNEFWNIREKVPDLKMRKKE